MDNETISDLTFITNEKSRKLLDRFIMPIKDTALFDALVGYFYTCGFHSLYRSLESTEKIRILIGINTNKEVKKLIQVSRFQVQPIFQFSHAEVKQEFENCVTEEMEQSEDIATVEEGVSKFIEWLKNDKLEIRAYPTENIHAKHYIMTFKKGDRDIGRVITGSSNFTQSGLADNLEFNVELKNRSDYDFALQKFNELWKNAVDVKDRYAESKINAFLTLLGGDAAILTEGEPFSSHELFNRLISKKTISGEEGAEESEIKYLDIIKDIRDKDLQLFEKIKRLPKKARSAKVDIKYEDFLLTYFRLEKIQKFFIVSKSQQPQEVDFITAARVFEYPDDEKKQNLSKDFYELLDSNKKAFIDATTEENLISEHRRGRDSGSQILKILKAMRKAAQIFTDEQENYLKQVIRQLEEGALPKQTTKKTLKALNNLKSDLINPLKLLATLKYNIPGRLLESHYSEYSQRFSGKREVILSLDLAGDKNDENS